MLAFGAERGRERREKGQVAPVREEREMFSCVTSTLLTSPLFRGTAAARRTPMRSFVFWWRKS